MAPTLPLRSKAVLSAPYRLPLCFYDAAPDGWGRSVLAFAYPGQTWGMAEFLAAAGDDRSGDLLFGPDLVGPRRFIPENGMIALPDEDASLEALLVLGSADVGGARPKTRIQRNGQSWIAKFPAQGDTGS